MLLGQFIPSSLGAKLVKPMDLKSAIADMICHWEVFSYEKLLEDLDMALGSICENCPSSLDDGSIILVVSGFPSNQLLFFLLS